MQSFAIRKVLSQLTSKEQDIIRRGRNTNSTVPKSATVLEYRYATGFESIILLISVYY